MNKLLLTAIILCILVTPMSTFAQSLISIDHVDGISDGKILPDVPIKFHLRWTNNFGTNITGGLIAYRIFIRNNIELASGQFDPPIIDTLPIGFGAIFDLGVLLENFGADGIGSDSVSIAFGTIDSAGLPDGFDELVGYITTKVSSDFAGDSLCIDSTFVNTHHWTWISKDGHIYPDWSGPHCYEILPSCCVGVRGNVDLSSAEEVDISDLVMLVDFIFTGGIEPYCPTESDITSDGEVDISDLVALVDFIFTNGTPPPACP